MKRMTHERLVTIVTDEIALMLDRGDLSAEQEDQILACLEKAYGNLGQVRVQNRETVRAWLLRILRNMRADMAHHQARWPEPMSLGELDRMGQEPACQATDPARLALSGEQRRRIGHVQEMLEQVLAGLEPDRAWLFRIRFYDEMSVPEVAARLGISQKAVVMRYQRLRRRVFGQLVELLRKRAPEIVEFFTLERHH